LDDLVAQPNEEYEILNLRRLTRKIFIHV
jgi:hypothetical protein